MSRPTGTNHRSSDIYHRNTNVGKMGLKQERQGQRDMFAICYCKSLIRNKVSCMRNLELKNCLFWGICMLYCIWGREGRRQLIWVMTHLLQCGFWEYKSKWGLMASAFIYWAIAQTTVFDFCVILASLFPLKYQLCLDKLLEVKFTKKISKCWM